VFFNCSSLTSITIPASVRGLGPDAFSSCSSLTAVYFMGNAPSIISGIFNSSG